ncbi:MAG TPA: hypothetical protein DDW29_13790 [Gammaproteobacteria bacterium]|nr:hypothetical protein [Gammaproteobacteria bacterium]|tara:strand:+ start:125 stop:331 length:207 start_codon:yes stop_codon:yes gene_type:complete
MNLKFIEYINKIWDFIERPVPLIIFSGLCLWRVAVIEIPDYDKGVITGWIFASLFYKFIYEPQKNNKE